MFEGIANFFKKLMKTESKQTPSKETAKERLHLVLMQDRANVSADFLELMKQEIIEVIKKYIEVEESAIDVRLTKEVKEDGSQGAPSLYANIPILNIKNDMKSEIKKEDIKEEKIEETAPKKEEEKSDEKIENKQENVEETPVGGALQGDPKEENKESKLADNKSEKEESVNEESIKEEKTEENKQEKTTEKKNN